MPVGASQVVAVRRASPLWVISLLALVLSACGAAGPSLSEATPGPSLETVDASASAPVPAASVAPDWYGVELTDVRTGNVFSINDFAGRVVLIETMAEWCPTCVVQQDEVKRLHELLGSSGDLVSVSLDIDVNEDAASLKEYAAALDLDWHVAVAPLEVARALGNLYSAEYLNPPFSPMLVIDRHGAAIQLPYGVKKAEDLREMLEPYLAG
jgi:thiol-disulfide isomerase/thioredoxin